MKRTPAGLALLICVLVFLLAGLAWDAAKTGARWLITPVGA